MLRIDPVRPSATSVSTFFAAALAALFAFFWVHQALGAEPVKITAEDTAFDLTKTTEIYRNQGNAFQVSTAAGANGIVRRIEVRASSDESHGDWAVFALANVSDQQLDRVIVAPHFRLANSHIFWPDLGSRRIIAITPSEGFSLERLPSNEADVFQITLNPGAVVTFVAELATPDLPQLYLWEPEAYKDTVNAFTLYHGIVLGIAGLLAVILTILFVVRGTAMLPAAGALAWAVLGYVCVDFGFLEKLINISPADQRIWRAGTEVTMAVSLVLFLFTYLNLNRWHTHLGYVTFAWICGLGLLAAGSVYDPSVAAGIARISFALTAAAGVAAIIYLTVQRYDRAVLLIPSWALIIAWLVAAWLTVTGEIDNDIVQPALTGGMVLIVLMIGFTVMQHAFSGGGFQHGLFSDLERQSLALTGSGETIWDWDVSRDRVVTMPDVAARLGLAPGTLNGAVRTWLAPMHPDDQDRFRATMEVLLEHRKGRLEHEFRLRARDGHYHWLKVRARPVLGANGEVIRCVGTLGDVTDEKTAMERLLHNSVHDNLTGLPNRELFIDRLQSAINQARDNPRTAPTVMLIGLDRFLSVNDRLGIMAGDNILIVLTRRLQRLLKTKDTLARIAGDQFGLILTSETEPQRVADFADAVLQAIKVPIDYGGEEISLTASAGLVSWVEENQDAVGMINDAELALYRGKRGGGDRVEPFRPAFRTSTSEHLQIEADLRRAIDRRQLSMVYQPIFRLEDRSIAGAEALMRWDHPRLGEIPPSQFIPIAEKNGLINQIGMFALDRAAADLSNWKQNLGDLSIFVSVNLSSAQLLNKELYDDFQAVLGRSGCSADDFALELTETLVMENPERSRQMLNRLHQAGFRLSLDDFGTGYSALGYLTELPFTTVKLDRSLVTGNDARGQKLLKSVATMIGDLGMKVVAEGIATEEEIADLRDVGVEYGQSHYLGPPLTAATLQQLLKETLVKA